MHGNEVLCYLYHFVVVDYLAEKRAHKGIASTRGIHCIYTVGLHLPTEVLYSRIKQKDKIYMIQGREIYST